MAVYTVCILALVFYNKLAMSNPVPSPASSIDTTNVSEVAQIQIVSSASCTYLAGLRDFSAPNVQHKSQQAFYGYCGTSDVRQLMGLEGYSDCAEYAQLIRSFTRLPEFPQVDSSSELMEISNALLKGYFKVLHLTGNQSANELKPACTYLTGHVPPSSCDRHTVCTFAPINPAVLNDPCNTLTNVADVIDNVDDLINTHRFMMQSAGLVETVGDDIDINPPVISSSIARVFYTLAGLHDAMVTTQSYANAYSALASRFGCN